MELSTALRLKAGGVVAFVGAGGKTSCLRRLASELSTQKLVIATTTTKLAAHEAALAPLHLVINTSDELDRLLANLPEVGAVLITGPGTASGGKWTAPTPADVQRLIAFTKEKQAILLIEADGARGAMVKAPAAHEPVIPEGADLVVPLIRIDAVGLRPADDQVHRPARLARLLGIEQDESLSIAHLAALISHAEGALKGIPGQAVVRLFINAVESNELRSAAEKLADRVQHEARIWSVISGSLNAADPVEQVWSKTGVIVLAAGGSQRFGAPKLLQPWQGIPLLRHVVERVLASGIQPALVVLGADSKDVEVTLSDLPISRIYNPDWAQGQSSSLKLGLRAIQDRCEAVLFVLGDMPDLGLELLRTLVAAHRRTLHPIIAPYAGDRWGNPVLFDQRTFDELLSLSGDRGGRALFERYPPFSVPADKGVLFDIDTPADLEGFS